MLVVTSMHKTASSGHNDILGKLLSDYNLFFKEFWQSTEITPDFSVLQWTRFLDIKNNNQFTKYKILYEIFL